MRAEVRENDASVPQGREMSTAGGELALDKRQRRYTELKSIPLNRVSPAQAVGRIVVRLGVGTALTVVLQTVFGGARYFISCGRRPHQLQHQDVTAFALKLSQDGDRLSDGVRADRLNSKTDLLRPRGYSTA